MNSQYNKEDWKVSAILSLVLKPDLKEYLRSTGKSSTILSVSFQISIVKRPASKAFTINSANLYDFF